MNTLTIATSGPNPIATLDLSNNEMVIDYTGTSPLAGTLSTGLGRWIAYANAGGAWDQPGVKSSFCNAGTFGIGYGEASAALGLAGSNTTTWNGQVVDATSVLLKLTYYGGSDLDGAATESELDHMLDEGNWKEAGLWTDGDYDYSGDVDEADFDLAMNNLFATPVGRPGDGTLPPLARAYMVLLDHPQAYWDIRAYPPVWDRLSEYETWGLGPIPAQPTSRGIPEPCAAVASAATALGLATRRRRG